MKLPEIKVETAVPARAFQIDNHGETPKSRGSLPPTPRPVRTRRALILRKQRFLVSRMKRLPLVGTVPLPPDPMGP
ncbi:MAG: hypothetical protein QOH88_1656 [Verrucomicrobiota bacterium]|jgi:hypothetical protein